MRNRVSVFVFSCAVLAGAVGMMAQQAPAAPQGRAGGPPAGPSNLKVLPNTWTTRQVGTLMQTFTESLGVTCEHCHAVDPDAPAPPPGRPPRLKYDLDDKPEKEIARTMIKMTMSLNETTKDLDDKTVVEKVSCFTCHRGDKKPLSQPADGWRRGGFSLLPAGPTAPPRGGGPGGAPGGAPPAPPAAN